MVAGQPRRQHRPRGPGRVSPRPDVPRPRDSDESLATVRVTGLDEGVHLSTRVSTRGKVVTSRWLDPGHGGLDIGFPTHS